MRTAICKGSGDDLPALLVNNHLCFLGVTLLFAAVVLFLLFFGRSIGCSLASTSTNFDDRYRLVEVSFLPGK